MLRLVALLLIAGCTMSGHAGDGLVRIGQDALVGGPRVRPVALVEDSRCPTSTQCIWAGRVVVRADVTTGAGTRRRDLTLGEPVQVADGALTLVRVVPERTTAETPAPAAYRFAFRFDGGL